MIDIKGCKIVQDLLPNYIEKLTSEETNQYIEEHLKSCQECKNIYENMKNNLDLHIEKSDKRPILFFKKYKNKLNILRMMLLIILLIFVISIGRKMIIISDLSNKAKKYEAATNYHTINYSYNQEESTKVEVFRLGDKKKMIMTYLTDEGITTITMFGKNKIMENEGFERYVTNIYIEKGNKKTVLLNQDMGISGNIKNILDTDNLWLLFQHSIKSTIKTTTFDGNKCFYIANYQGLNMNNPEGVYINKENGLPISAIAFEYENSDGEKERAGTKEFVYEFNTVSEDVFKEPNIEDYEKTDKLDF